jgi:S1-C subfamily serine protease
MEPPLSARKKRSYAWGFFLGLIMVGVGFGLLYYFFYVKVLYNAQVSLIDTSKIQSAKIDLLEEGLERYQKASEGDVCLRPNLAEEAPFFILPPPDPPEAGSPPPSVFRRQRETLNAIRRSVVLIQATGQTAQGETFIARGSGFFINKNTILTNRRLVDGLGPNGSILAINGLRRQSLQAEILGLSSPLSLRDYALLRVDPGDNPAQGLKLGETAQAAEQVLALGFPDSGEENDVDQEPIFAKGAISSIITDLEVPLINHTAEMSSLFRGGPVVNRQGQVIGLSALITIEGQPARQIQVALGGADLRDFLSETGARFE